MGRGRGKGKKFTLTNNDDTGSGEEERIPAQKRRGRPQKPLVDETDEDNVKMEDEENSQNTKANDDASNKDLKETEDGKKRKRNKQSNEGSDLVKEESVDGTRSNTNGSTQTQVNGFRHIGSRRKSKPRRAAEAGVECI